jgi:hypothetical protein
MTDRPHAHEMAQGLLGDVRLLVSEVLQLREALSRRMSVERATGILMFRFAVDSETALRLLGQWASLTDSSLSRVAEAVLDCAGEESEPAGADPVVRRLVTGMLHDPGLRGRPRPR